MLFKAFWLDGVVKNAFLLFVGEHMNSAWLPRNFPDDASFRNRLYPIYEGVVSKPSRNLEEEENQVFWKDDLTG